MAAPTCTTLGDLAAATCGGLFPLEYWFFAGVALMVATLFVHLWHTDRVPWQGRVLAAVLGFTLITMPFTAFTVSSSVDALQVQGQLVKQQCLDLQDRLVSTGCDGYNGSLAVRIDNRTFDCADLGHVPPNLCQSG